MFSPKVPNSLPCVESSSFGRGPKSKKSEQTAFIKRPKIREGGKVNEDKLDSSRARGMRKKKGGEKFSGERKERER